VKSGRDVRSLAVTSVQSMSASAPIGRMLATLAAWTRFALDTASGSKVRDLTSSPLANLTNSVGNLGSEEMRPRL